MSHRILICDDDVCILRAAEYKLARAGYEVRCANDGQAGWELLMEWLPDALVSDVQMPRLNGLQLLDRVRQHPAIRSLPVVLLTGKAYELMPTTVADLGVIRVLPKPFSPRELLKIIDETLASPCGIASVSDGFSNSFGKPDRGLPIAVD